MILKGPAELENFADECIAKLIVASPDRFYYPAECGHDHWPVAAIKELNKELLQSLGGAGNVYAIHVRAAGHPWSVVYVGQRKSAGLRNRLTQHLINKDARTGAMLDRVKQTVAEGSELAISFIKVEPESLRLFVEETIISEMKKSGQLEWNTHC